MYRPENTHPITFSLQTHTELITLTFFSKKKKQTHAQKQLSFPLFWIKNVLQSTAEALNATQSLQDWKSSCQGGSAELRPIYRGAELATLPSAALQRRAKPLAAKQPIPTILSAS